jgi:predicted peroxiredoxin
LARSPRRTNNAAMRILITAAAGPSDPTRASIPLHIAVNGCVPEGQEVHVVLAGDATELAVGDTVERIEGVGVPPMRELVAKLIEHRVPVYV